jgi:hypothetical protein
MKLISAIFVCLLGSSWLLAPCPAAEVDFVHDVAPILKKRCIECHLGKEPKGDVSFETRQMLVDAKLVVPGKSGESELVKRLLSKDPDLRMPPQGDPLDEKQIATIRAWIDQGVKWDDNYSFKPRTYKAPLKLQPVTLPPSRDGREHPIDRLVDAYLAQHQLPFPAPLPDALFARRVSLDLVGLLPDVDATTAFAASSSPDKRTVFVAALLADQRAYADHWLSFWNDLLRNEYRGTGYIDGGRKQISVWLYEALAKNKPYNEFVHELIAPTPASEGFINGIQWRGSVNASQTREVQFSQNISQVFFGINMKCASCHDSFVDDWKLSEAYGLAAIVAEKPLELHRCDKPTGVMAKPAFLWPELGNIDPTAKKPERLKQLADLVTHRDNGRFARTIANRMWQRLMGRGLVHPVDALDTAPVDPQLLEYLANYLVEQNYDLKKLLAHIVTSRIYQSQVVLVPQTSMDEYRFRGPLTKRMTAEQFTDAVWMLTLAGPAKIDAPLKPVDFAEATPSGRRFIRAVLVHADLLQRSLGRPNREQVVTVRPDELTTLQALDLSNGAVLTNTLQKGADKILKDAGQEGLDAQKLVTQIYQQGLARAPQPTELQVAIEFLGAKPDSATLADWLWTIVMLPEFQLIR